MNPNVPVSLRFVEGKSDKTYSVTVVPADGDYNVVAAWGRTGSTMQTAVKTAAPVALETARAMANKLLDAKRRKGYSDAEGGVAYSDAEYAGRDTGYRTQLLEPVAEGQAEQMLDDPRFVMQEKYDAERRLVILDPGERAYGANRNGLRVALNDDLAHVCVARVPVTGLTVIDGEDYGATFAPFDLLFHNGEDLRDRPYSERLERLESIIVCAPEFPRLVTYRTTEQKRRAYAKLRAGGYEGVVFKRLDAPYTPGRGGRDGDQFKDKFVESATCRVRGRNGDKRSVGLELIDAGTGEWVFMGNCTIPASHPIPQEMELCEVQYLYAMPNQGCLIQPVYAGVRRDIDPRDCTTTQLKYKREQAAA